MEKLLDRTPFCRVREHVGTKSAVANHHTGFLSFLRSSVANYDTLHAFDRGKKMKEKRKGMEISKRLIIERTKGRGWGDREGEAKEEEGGCDEREREGGGN